MKREAIEAKQPEMEEGPEKTIADKIKTGVFIVLKNLFGEGQAKVGTDLIFSKNVTELYDKAAEYYDRYYIGDFFTALGISKDILPKGDAALDIACGTGLSTLPLLEKFKRVVGLDLSAGMLEKANEELKQKGIFNLSFIRGDMTEMPFTDNSFDALTCIGAVFHLSEEQEQNFAREARVLRPGGTLVITPEAKIRSKGLNAKVEKTLFRLANPLMKNKIRFLDFTPNYTEAMLKRAGFKTEQVKIRRWQTEIVVAKKPLSADETILVQL
ncbi:MAG: methyltransferase domain-containing protein [bacterium]